MVILMLTPPVLSPGFTHDASDYQISVSPTFETDTIVKEVLGETTNKLVKTFDLDLDPAVTYYARARYVFNRFIAEWSNVDIIIPKDATDLNIHMDIPSIVSIPQVTIDNDLNNMPTTFFTISTNSMTSTSNSTHISTSYIISDTNGDIAMSVIESADNLTSLKVFKDKLQENTTYILYVAHHSSSGDISDFAKVVFNTTKIGDVDLLSSQDVVKDTSLLVKLAPVDNVNMVYTELYSVGLNENKLIHTQESTVFSFSISNSYYIDKVDDYVLSVKYRYTDGSFSPIRYFTIKTV